MKVIALSASRSITRCQSDLVGVHERLGVSVGAARRPLDQVAADGERGAGERQQRHVVGECSDEQIDGVAHVRDVVGFERAEAIEIGGRSKWPLGDRAGPGLDVDAEPDSVRWHDDVAVEDRGVDAVAAHRLQRDLGGELGLLDRIEDRAVAAYGPILGQAAPGLAHEPHRGVPSGSAGGGVEEGNAASRWGLEFMLGEDATGADRVSRPPIRRSRAATETQLPRNR